MGSFDLDADGVAEELWNSGYKLWNLMTALLPDEDNEKVR